MGRLVMRRFKAAAESPRAFLADRVTPVETFSREDIPDHELAERAFRGDEAAFETLVLRYQDRIYNLILRLIGNREEAEDLTQEAFLKAYRALAGFQRHAGFFTWLYRIALNTCFSRGRQLSRKKLVETTSLNGWATPGDADGPRRQLESAAPSPESLVGKREIQGRVQEAIANLPEEYRAVVLLRDMEGLGYEEISAVLGTTGAAVKSRLYRARLVLAEKLKDLRD